MSILRKDHKNVNDKVLGWFRQERSQDFRKYISHRELELRGYSKRTACISDISERRKAQSSESQYLRVFPGYTEVRNIKVEDGHKDGNKSERKGGGRRGWILGFSDKSRMTLIKVFLRLESYLPYWQDFTFPDDVMTGLGIKGRADRAREIWKRFIRKCEAEGIEVNGIYKREWKKRKRGKLIGEFVPHYHFLYNLGGEDEKFQKLALLWVQSTKTEMFEEALRVAIHENSYRMIKSKKQAQKYVSEYVSKNEGFFSEESIGRSWAVVGEIKLAEGEEIQISDNESTAMKRIFRKLYRGYRKNENMRIRLRNKMTEFTMFVESLTIERLIEEMRLTVIGDWFGAVGATG